ncbi:MAG: PTS sugar transporter subunit IIA [Chlorobi bacterium]|nr:PTS sugar transporter subunit IIA [Chlorobiota bacterium]
MNISDILTVERIIPELKGRTKEEAINEIIDLLNDDESIRDLETVRKAVIEREKIMSTGVGSGFAIPHGKTDGVRGIVAAFGKTSNPIDFEAIDNKPVNLIFLLVGEESMVAPHIKMLSKISRLMNKAEIRDRLSQSKTAEEIYEIFKTEEEKLSY